MLLIYKTFEEFTSFQIKSIGLRNMERFCPRKSSLASPFFPLHLSELYDVSQEADFYVLQEPESFALSFLFRFCHKDTPSENQSV